MEPTTQDSAPTQASDSAPPGRPGAFRRLFEAIVPLRTPEQKKALAEALEIEFAEQARQWMAALRAADAPAMRALQKSKPLSGRVEELHAARDAAGRTPLMLAAASGHASAVELVLKNYDLHGFPRLGLRSGSVEEHPAKNADFDGLTALAHAARAGHARCVQLLMNASDTGFRDKRGEIALMHATRLGHVECVALLAPLSRDRPTWNLASSTPLAMAVRSGRVDLAEIMLAAGLGREAMTRPFLGENLFCLAARLKGQEGRFSAALLDALARHGLGGSRAAEATRLSAMGPTASDTSPPNSSRTPAGRDLSDDSAGIVWPDWTDRSPDDDPDGDNAPGPDTLDAFGKTPLHCAAEADNLGAVLWLARAAPHTANIKTRLSGSTPLHLAAHANSAAALSGLLPFCDPSLTDGLGETAFAAALSRGHLESAQVLAPFSPLLAPEIPRGELASLTRLRVPIFRAVSSGRPELAAWLAQEIEQRHGPSAAQESARAAFEFAVGLGTDNSFASADFLAPWIDAAAILFPWSDKAVSADRQARHEADLPRKMPRAFAKMEAELLSRESGLFGAQNTDCDHSAPRRL